MRHTTAVLAAQLVLLAVAQRPGHAADNDPLQTAAERTGYQATSTHAEVMEFCRRLADRSEVVHLSKLGRSEQGRELPLLILADPPVSSPSQVPRAEKLVVFAIGNIHGGEVCGKEALLMLARDIGLAEDRSLLKHLVIALAPIFNADGNEPFSTEHRPKQVGPDRGVGVRTNANGLDLNRDFVKLESAESRGLASFLNRWDPSLVIDTHTTNGSYHRYTLTYDGPRHPATHPALVSFVRDEFLPQVGRQLENETGYRSFYYGNFDAGHTRWHSYPALPRYAIQYVGLRNRMAILSEAYAYAPYRDRVLATRGFVQQCLQRCSQQRERIAGLLEEARKATVNRGSGKQDASNSQVAIRSEPAAMEGKHTVLGFVEELVDGTPVATDQPKDYEVEYLGVERPTLSVTAPQAYLVPPRFAAVVENLHSHGVQLQVLREDIELDVETYRIEALERSDRLFQGHQRLTIEAQASAESQRFPAGTIVVSAGQALGSLVVNLLEPAAEDGLASWNFFGSELTAGKPFPVARLMEDDPFLVAPYHPPAARPVAKKPITFETVYGRQRASFGGSPVSGFDWLEDGEHYLQVKQGLLRRIHATTGRSTPFVDPKLLAKTLSALPAIGGESAGKLAQAQRFPMTADRTGLLLEHENDLYFARRDGTMAVRLTSTPEQEELASFSPDGQFVAFVRDFDLHVVDVQTQTERALTTGGSSTLRNAKADWVYYEEFYGRNWKAYQWSPDSSSILFQQFDDSPVGQFTVIDQIPVRQQVEVDSYPKAGDPNPRVRLGTVSVAGGSVRWIDSSRYSPDNMLISRFGWLPAGDSVYFYVQDRAQRWLDFNTANARSGDSRRLLREQTPAWVDDPGAPRFLKDGSFLLLSSRSGWQHLYRFQPDGKLTGAITAGDWEVQQLHEVDEAGGWVYFAGTRDSHLATNLYRVKLDGSEPTRLTRADGYHRPIVAPGGKLFVDSYSDHRSPTKVNLCRADGQLARTLDTNPVPELEEYEFGQLELFQVKTRDGFLLECSLIKPPDFDAARKYPVWLLTYGGPHAPTLSDSWHGGRSFEQMIAQMGVLVLRCDPRSASGKGACSSWTAYRQLGVQELKDLEDALDWLCREPYVDAGRIGMSGHSYGGFLTAFALTHSTRFAAGIAGAPVTDWHNYDTIYTERYMDTPQENPDGYRATSVVAAAKDLHGRLLLLHGARDDNVHFQNTLQLVDALQRADKQFELMVYPQARHGIFGNHYQQLMVDFIRKTMLP